MGSDRFNGMNKRDWQIFMGSLILGNAYWTLACFMGNTTVEWVWKMVVLSLGYCFGKDKGVSKKVAGRL